MLILTRKIGEAIIINDDIEIVVVDVHNNQVKIGIEAPREIEVYREEIYLRIQQEKQANPSAD